MVLTLVLFLLALTSSQSLNSAEVYVPESSQTVVSILPEPVVRLAGRLRNAERSNAEVDLRSILESYNIATRQNSPRAYGHTLSLLNRWPAESPIPPVASLIKASVLQHNHHFASALVELDALLDRDPTDKRALQMASQVSLVVADYTLTRDYCESLRIAGYRLLALNCRAQVMGLTGEAKAALDQVSSALEERSLAPSTMLELRLTAAELSRRLGHYSVARSHYQAALTLAPDQSYLLINYSELLLLQEEPGVVLGLLPESKIRPADHELRLFLALALQKLNRQEESRLLVSELGTAITALSLRDTDRPHKLIARFQLEFGGRPEQALAAARSNWLIQKEPSDARLLARAAVASDSAQTLRELSLWLQKSGMEDAELSEILELSGTRMP